VDNFESRDDGHGKCIDDDVVPPGRCGGVMCDARVLMVWLAPDGGAGAQVNPSARLQHVTECGDVIGVGVEIDSNEHGADRLCLRFVPYGPNVRISASCISLVGVSAREAIGIIDGSCDPAANVYGDALQSSRARVGGKRTKVCGERLNGKCSAWVLGEDSDTCVGGACFGIKASRLEFVPLGLELLPVSSKFRWHESVLLDGDDIGPSGDEMMPEITKM
jgi:uncharacterized protein YbjQ (UPF0145 family)